jgi:di/tricarboxylate transporter
MTPQIAWTLAVVIGTVILLSIEKIRPDVVSLGVIVVLVLAGLLPIDQALAGFGSDTFIVILGLLILTAVLEKTGVVDLIGSYFLKFSSRGTRSTVLVLMGTVAVMSAVMSNTASAAFFLPIVIGLARQAKLNRSKMLLPLAFASILSSSVTLVATSTNIVVSGLITDLGLEPLGMFEMTPVGLVIVAAGLLYMATIGYWMIPERPIEESISSETGIQNYLTELLVDGGSPLCGKTLTDAKLGEDYDIKVIRIVKGNHRTVSPTPDEVLEEGDLLLVEGDRDGLIDIGEKTGLIHKPQQEVEYEAAEILRSDSVGLFEVILLPRSPLINRTLKQIGFRQRYGLQVLGINRSGQTIRRKLSEIRLQVGDQLLILGSGSGVSGLSQSNVFRVLQTLGDIKRNKKEIAGSVAIFAGVLLLAGLGLVPLPIAILIGMILAFILRLITPEEAYQSVDWRVLFVISSMLALGAAMEHTGTAQYLANWIVSVTQTLSPTWLLGGFFLLTMLLSQPMSNQAASAVVIPIAIETALHLGLNPRTFAVMIAVGASTSFLTPLEPACLMVYGPGNYRFVDFLKVGSLLSVIIFVIAIVMVPLFWPFF